jgi:hypothetical protein
VELVVGWDGVFGVQCLPEVEPGLPSGAPRFGVAFEP